MEESPDPSTGGGRRVFLIHGMGRSTLSLLVMKWRLEGLGHRVTLFGYMVTFQGFHQIVDRFVERVKETVAEDAETGGPPSYAVVSHSLGGVITRAASPRLPPGFEAFVMLAPPNHPPAMVRLLGENPLFRALTQDAGKKLGDDAFYRNLPVPDVPTRIIAGNRGIGPTGLPPFKGKPNDGIVAVEETRLEGIDHQVVPAIHSFLMNRRDVFEAVTELLGPNGDGVQSGRG